MNNSKHVNQIIKNNFWYKTFSCFSKCIFISFETDEAEYWLTNWCWGRCESSAWRLQVVLAAAGVMDRLSQTGRGVTTSVAASDYQLWRIAVITATHTQTHTQKPFSSNTHSH